MKNNSIYFLLILICIFITLSMNVFSVDINKKSPDELLKIIDDNLMPGSYESYLKIVDIEPDGNKKESVFYRIKKGNDKVALLYLLPESEKGRVRLRQDENIWLYIPSVGKPIRLTSLQSATGGVFNNADVMRLDYSVEYNAETLEKLEDGLLFDLKAKTKFVTYDRLKMWTTKDLTLKRIECYSASGMLLKTLEFKEIKDFGNGVVRPSVIETYSPLYKGYRSIMIYGSIKKRNFPDEVFTLNYLPKIEELR